MSLPAIVLYPVLAVATTAAASAFLWFQKPGIFLKLGMKLALYRTGAKVKFIQGKKYKYCYAERGEPDPSRPSLVLVHGFSSSKDMFVPVIQRMPKHIHVLLIDLPGHGESTIPTESTDISIVNLTDSLDEFVELKGLTTKPFHLLGTSMGGTICVLYAFEHAKHLALLSLVCPGVRTPVTNSFIQEMREGRSRLTPNSINELKFMLDSCFHNKTLIPKGQQILKGILQLREPKKEFCKKLMGGMSEGLNSEDRQQKLEADAPKITCPTQLIWGKQDEIVDPSGAEYLQKVLPNVQRLDLIDECGHSVTMERPGMLTKVLLQFRGELQDNKKKE